MKLHAAATTALNTFTAYGPGYVEINRQRYAHPVLVAPEGEVVAWEVDGFESLTPAHFSRCSRGPARAAGTGERQRFPHPRLPPRSRRRASIDVMDTRGVPHLQHPDDGGTARAGRAADAVTLV